MRHTAWLALACLACTDPYDAKEIDTGAPSAGVGTATGGAGTGGTGTAGTGTGGSGTATGGTGTATGTATATATGTGTATGTATGTGSTGWTCADGPATPRDLVPIENTCGGELGIDPRPWTLTCGAPGSFALAFGPTDPYPLACTHDAWTFACEAMPPGTRITYTGTFPAADRMGGEVHTQVADPGCELRYLWDLDLG